MTSRTTTVLATTALVAATALVTTQVVSQEHGGQPDMDAMMEAYLKMSQPGVEHAKLARRAGEWTLKTTHWMYPGAEAQVSSATSTIEPVLGGRFFVERMRGEMDFGSGPMPYEAMGIYGYDNQRQKHFYSWMDNMGTMAVTGEGQSDGDTLTYHTTMPNPMTGGTMTLRSVSKLLGDDRQTFEMFEAQPDGSWHRSLEIVSTRR